MDVKTSNYLKPAMDHFRVKVLHSLNLLDTDGEPVFDELVRLATVVAEMPIGAFSLIDQDRQWFKARVGLEMTETSRELSFCTHTILDPSRALIIPDMTQSELFKNHPFVINGAGSIKSYAGFPINAPNQGFTIGSLCLIDRVPRTLSPAQLHLLGEIARSITNAIEARAHAPGV